MEKRKFLNVGGGSKKTAVHRFFADWEHVLLDIDPVSGAEIICDARELLKLTGGAFDAIYCSHNLEHYYAHDVTKVVDGFAHVLKPGGFVYARVPDILDVMKEVLEKNLDIEDELYMSPAGSIKVHDVLYGFGRQMQRSGNDYYAHKMGFSAKSLNSCFEKSGFRHRITIQAPRELQIIASMQKPTEEILKGFGLNSLLPKE